ncbi:hypothetical protein [Sutterella sp.]|uniref:hypothetical protein n=1 Tax=Sutterella sp. TaxID=1981025 RepID=UPI003FD7E10C
MPPPPSSVSVAETHPNIPVVASLLFSQGCTTRRHLVCGPKGNAAIAHADLPFGFPDPNCFAILIRGSGLSPVVEDCDVLVLSPIMRAVPGEFVLVQDGPTYLFARVVACSEKAVALDVGRQICRIPIEMLKMFASVLMVVKPRGRRMHERTLDRSYAARALRDMVQHCPSRKDKVTKR